MSENLNVGKMPNWDMIFPFHRGSGGKISELWTVHLRNKNRHSSCFQWLDVISARASIFPNFRFFWS